MGKGLLGAIERSKFNLQRARSKTKDKEFKKVLDEKLKSPIYNYMRY